MLTFTYYGGTTIRVANGKKELVLFAEKDAQPAENELILFPAPEEEPRPNTISWPGEYDIEGVAIRGIGHDDGASVSYVIDFGNVRCAFLHSPLKEWSDYELELLGNVDVLALPTDEPKAFQKLLDEIDPRVLLPLDTGGPEKHAECIKICGAKDREEEEKFVLKGALPFEGREVVLLKAQK